MGMPKDFNTTLSQCAMAPHPLCGFLNNIQSVNNLHKNISEYTTYSEIRLIPQDHYA